MSSVDERTCFLLGLSSFESGDYEAAIFEWEKLPKADLGVEIPNIQEYLAEGYFRYGVSFYEQNQLARVISCLRKAVDLCPRRGVYSFHLGLAYHRNNNLDMTIQCYKKALELGFDRERCLRHLALVYYENNDSHSLEITAEEALSTFGSDSVIWLWFGALACVLKDDKCQAIKILEGAVNDLDGDFPNAAWTLALLYLDSGRAKDARSLLTVMSKSREDKWLTYYLGTSYYLAGSMKHAVDQFEKLLYQNQNMPGLRRACASAELQRCIGFLERGRLRKAVELLRLLLEYYPKEAEMQETLSHVLSYCAYQFAVKRDLDNAVALWRLAYTLGSKDVSVLHNLALAYDGLEEYDESVKYWRLVIKEWNKELRRKADGVSKKQLAVAHAHLADTYSKMGEESKAISEWGRALQVDPENIDLALKRGNTRLEESIYASAIKDFEYVLDLEPENVDALMGLARAYENREDFDKALAYLERAHAKAPENPGIQREIIGAYLRSAGTEWHNDNMELVDHWMGKARSIDPDDAHLVAIHARMYLLDRDLDRAEALFRQAVDVEPGNPLVLVSIGGFWLEYGDKKRARQEFDRALAMEPGNPVVYLRIGNEYYEHGHERNAIINFNKSIALIKDDYRIPALIADIMLEHQDYERAEKYFRKAFDAAKTQDLWNVAVRLRFAMAMCANSVEDYEGMDKHLRALSKELWRHDIDDAIREELMEMMFALRVSESMDDFW